MGRVEGEPEAVAHLGREVRAEPRDGGLPVDPDGYQALVAEVLDDEDLRRQRPVEGLPGKGGVRRPHPEHNLPRGSRHPT